MTTPSSPARRLATQGGVYAIGNALVKLSGLLLAPLYLDTTILSRAEYGQFSLLDVTGSLATLLFGLGMTSALIKHAADETFEGRNSIPFTALVVALASGVTAVLAFGLLGRPVASLFLDSAEAAGIVRWYGLYVGLQVALLVPYAYLRFQEWAPLFVVARVVEIGLLILGVFLFLGKMRLGLAGIVYAYAGSSAIALALLVTAMLTQIPLTWNGAAARRLLSYGAPLAIGLVAAPLLHAGDRYLIDWILGEEPLSSYFWATRLSGVLNMFVVQSFSLAFAVIGIKALSASRVDVSLHRRSFRHYVIWSGWLVLALSLLAPNVTAVLTEEAVYISASSLVFPLSVGYLFYGAYLIVVNALYSTGRTRIVGSMVVAATVLNAILNLVLMKPFGLFGAATATVLAYASLFGGAVLAARSSHDINYSWKTLFLVLLVTVGLYWVGMRFATVEQLTWTSNLPVRLGIVLLYGVAVIALGLYRISEIRAGVARLATIFRRT